MLVFNADSQVLKDIILVLILKLFSLVKSKVTRFKI